jgi:ABC-type branched-subunit amino acid transport system permease subunit
VYVLGLIFVLVTLFLPAGVMGLRPLQARAE